MPRKSRATGRSSLRTRTRTTPSSSAGALPAPLLPAVQPSAPAPRSSSIDAPEAQELWQGYLAVRRKFGPDSPQLESWRNALLERHLPLVRFVAERLARGLPRSLLVDDLVSAGVFGLMDALRGYDPERAVRFRTYAAARVRGAMLDSLRSSDWVPRLVRLRAARLERALAKLAGVHGREPTHAELGAELDIPQADMDAELGAARPRSQHRLGERGRDGESDIEFEAALQDKRTRTPLEEVQARELLRSMRPVLTHKENFILEQYYEVGHTMREIGELLSLTESRVCQIHTTLLGRLRALYERRRRQGGE